MKGYVKMDKEEFTAAHISQKFNDDMQELRNQILSMGGLVEKQIVDAVKALVEGDSELAIIVRNNERTINQCEIVIDEECTRIIALRQPAASDLRLVLAITKIISDLERVGDEANKIAKMAILLAEQGQSPRGYNEIRHIGSLVVNMLHRALDAFTRLDAETAFEVAQEDSQVDIEYESAMRQLVTYMIEDPRSISRVINVMWALRALERIGDHSRNISEQIIFVVKGKDVRHRSMEQIKHHVFED